MPETERELIYALAFSDRHLGVVELDQLSRDIQAGAVFTLSKEEKDELRPAANAYLENGGYLAIAKADAQKRAAAERAELLDNERLENTRKIEWRPPCAPDAARPALLDLTNASVRRLVITGKSRGWVTLEEVYGVLPSSELSAEDIERVMTALSEMGITVIESGLHVEAGAGNEGLGLHVREVTQSANLLGHATEDWGSGNDAGGGEVDAGCRGMTRPYISFQIDRLEAESVHVRKATGKPFGISGRSWQSERRRRALRGFANYLLRISHLRWVTRKKLPARPVSTRHQVVPPQRDKRAGMAVRIETNMPEGNDPPSGRECLPVGSNSASSLCHSRRHLSRSRLLKLSRRESHLREPRTIPLFLTLGAS